MRPQPSNSADYFDVAYQDYAAQNPDRKLDHYLNAVGQYLGDQMNVKLLDIGCGRGAFLRRASERFPHWKLKGTDVDEKGVDFSRQLVPSAVITQADAADQIYDDGTFDAVTTWDVLEHLEGLPDVPDVVIRLLKPGGVFAFVVPVYDGVTGPIIRRLDRDPTHLHKHPRQWWLDWASNHFEVLTWHGVFRYLITGRVYIHVPTKVIRNHSPAILVVARSR